MSKEGNNIINAYKRPGETPLEAIDRLRGTLGIVEDVPITYAGRLDPMAEGVLLLLVGDAVHQKDELLNLEKEYCFKILFGFSTDTFDTLGICMTQSRGEEKVNRENLQNVLRESVGEQEQAYPPYSSKPVNGKPLFQWAKERRLDEIEIPKHMVHISDLWLKNFSSVTGLRLREDINTKVSNVRGDFRQKEILQAWEKVIEDKDYHVADIHMSCGSGTYVRALVHDIGKKLGVPATTLHIVRNRVGEYMLENAVR